MTFGQRLRKTREFQDLTREALANKSLVAASSIRNYEQDTVVPSIYVAADLAQALEVSLEWLILGTNTKKPRTGEWIVHAPVTLRCSLCGRHHYHKDIFCPGCGARMEGE
jgi:transcriptional regulator with XRE-family HTH domain